MESLAIINCILILWFLISLFIIGIFCKSIYFKNVADGQKFKYKDNIYIKISTLRPTEKNACAVFGGEIIKIEESEIEETC